MGTTLTVVRHGNTGKAKNDLERELSSFGYEQARRRGIQLGCPRFDLVLSSPTFRAKATAMGIACADPRRTAIIKPIPELYPLPNPVLEGMFQELGYSPIRQYMEHPDYGQLVRVCLTAISAVLGQIRPSSDDRRILVVGHAVILPIMAYEAEPSAAECLLDFEMDECGAFKVFLDEHNEVTGVELLPSVNT